MVRSLARDESALSDWIVLGALVLAVAVVLGAYYVLFTPTPVSAPRVAQLGDTVYVDYVGYFQNDNLVFDTSVRTVAADNATHPKAFSFSWHSTWNPLQFTVGGGSVVKGFDEGVQGLSVGQTTTIVVPPDLGYGAGNPSLVHTYPLVQTFPVRVTMNETAFDAYYGQTAVSGTNVSDPVYGWSVSVSILNGLVVVINSPYPSQELHPYGLPAWKAVVLTVDDGANNGTGLITIQNGLDPSQVDQIGATSSGRTFYLSAVDPVAGTYTLDYNKQVVGRTLVFQVTLVRLSPAV